MFKTIVVATDGSAHGSRALDVAGQIARDGGHSVVIVHVTELVGGKGEVVPLAADEDDLRAALESNAKELQADGIAAEVVTPIVRLGGPAHAIVEVADSVKAVRAICATVTPHQLK